MNDPGLKFNYKIWISKKKTDEYILGTGGSQLLKEIRETHDLGKASTNMNISYRKAWNILQKIKKNSGENPVITHKGGTGGGGGIELSESGNHLLESYIKLENFIQKAIEEFEAVNEQDKKKS